MKNISYWYWLMIIFNITTVGIFVYVEYYVLAFIWALVLLLNTLNAIEKVYKNDESRQSNSS